MCIFSFTHVQNINGYIWTVFLVSSLWFRVKSVLKTIAINHPLKPQLSRDNPGVWTQ